MNEPRLRIATYNLQKCVGLDMRRRPDRSLQVINALGADLVVLQEADKRLQPRPAALPHDLVERDGWRILPFGAPGGSLGWHGNAMLARRDLAVRHTRHVDLPGLEPRGAVMAELDTSIGPLRVVGVHLGLVRRYRLLQMMAVMRVVARCEAMPLVLAGDFNEWRRPAAMRAAASGLEFAPTPASYPAPRPVGKLDRIAHSPQLEVAATGVYTAKPAHITSDHLPVWADLTHRR
ncbi:MULTISPECIES: endonuclease/exonuclease/phosphatase family protein [unclassified Roseovarius]|uniref:endonuclease/exonuclease/phosphatase family protein n=1 Tax=unclassified Roseovarius TaxID=2614913 RepID=UPI00273DEFBF|nr:endonuclease/exonuclease/phosphatase family protein [Roseovarius sp. MMSF_3350]